MSVWRDLGYVKDSVVDLLQNSLPFTPYDFFRRHRLSSYPWAADGVDIIRKRAFRGGDDLFCLRMNDEDAHWYRFWVGEGPEPSRIYWRQRHYASGGMPDPDDRAMLIDMAERAMSEAEEGEIVDGPTFEVRLRRKGRVCIGTFPNRGGALVEDLMSRLTIGRPAVPKPILVVDNCAADRQ